MYLKMKQRTRPMHGDELLGYTMNTKKEEEDSADIPLHKMKTQDHFIEAQIQEGDTLQAIALRFYCSISELKRINQIHKDNEIFARRTIKVPVTPYSVLTERLPAQIDVVPSTSKNNLSSNYSIVNNHNGLPQTSTNHLEDKEINGNNDFAIDCNTIVLNSTLAPSVVPYTDVEPVESVSEDTQLLPSKPRESVETVVVKELTSHGADFGLKWYHLLFCVLLLGLIPLVYIFRNVHIVTHNVEANEAVLNKPQ